jgi:hypothetical protein
VAGVEVVEGKVDVAPRSDAQDGVDLDLGAGADVGIKGVLVAGVVAADGLAVLLIQVDDRGAVELEGIGRRSKLGVGGGPEVEANLSLVNLGPGAKGLEVVEVEEQELFGERKVLLEEPEPRKAARGVGHEGLVGGEADGSEAGPAALPEDHGRQTGAGREWANLDADEVGQQTLAETVGSAALTGQVQPE